MDIRIQLNRGGEFNARYACTQCVLSTTVRSSSFQQEQSKIGKVICPLPVLVTQANVAAWTDWCPGSLFGLRTSPQYTDVPQDNRMQTSLVEKAG